MRYLKSLIIIFLVIVVVLPYVNGLNEPGTRTPIKHVINIFFENHTFDNLFGVYPENSLANSTQDSIISNLTLPLNLLGNETLLHRMNAVPIGQFSTQDPIEGYLAYHQDWNHGMMNNFINGSGRQSMTYFTASQVSPLWDVAEEYALADNYFAPQISESAPNTLYYLTGFSPVINDYGPPPFIPFNETIFGELSSYGISWGVYVSNASSGSFDMSQYISGINNYRDNVQSWNMFLNQVRSGNLPAVSWIFAQDSDGYDMGAPSNILKGELWLIHLINSIEESPVWNTSTIFVTWDDPGGYFDQVSPPVFDGIQLGMRLPFLVISPYAKEDYISTTLITHSSILAFIDYNWKMAALNQFVSKCNIPLDMFDFDIPYYQGYLVRPPLLFNEFPVPASSYFSLNATFLNYNYSAAFPIKLQIDHSSLPYIDKGSSSFNLSSIQSRLFINRDTVYLPISMSAYSVLGFVVINSAIVFLIFWRRKNGK